MSKVQGLKWNGLKVLKVPVAGAWLPLWWLSDSVPCACLSHFRENCQLTPGFWKPLSWCTRSAPGTGSRALLRRKLVTHINHVFLSHSLKFSRISVALWSFPPSNFLCHTTLACQFPHLWANVCVLHCCGSWCFTADLPSVVANPRLGRQEDWFHEHPTHRGPQLKLIQTAILICSFSGMLFPMNSGLFKLFVLPVNSRNPQAENISGEDSWIRRRGYGDQIRPLKLFGLLLLTDSFSCTDHVQVCWGAWAVCVLCLPAWAEPSLSYQVRELTWNNFSSLTRGTP